MELNRKGVLSFLEVKRRLIFLYLQKTNNMNIDIKHLHHIVTGGGIEINFPKTPDTDKKSS